MTSYAPRSHSIWNDNGTATTGTTHRLGAISRYDTSRPASAGARNALWEQVPWWNDSDALPPPAQAGDPRWAASAGRDAERALFRATAAFRRFQAET